jgi:hypothetical protein
MNNKVPSPWYFALVAIDPSWSLYTKELDPSLYFFIILYLLRRHSRSDRVTGYTSRTVVEDRKSKYQRASKVGAGFQGTVFEVVDHPDKVVKNYSVRHERAYEHTKSTLRYDKIASDNHFGPIIHEVSVSGRVLNIEDDTTLPAFEKGLVFTVVMEKLEELSDDDAIDNCEGIVDCWKRMRGNDMINEDGFWGYSPIRRTVVSADFGAVTKTNGDADFITQFKDHLESQESIGAVDPQVAKKYVGLFPSDKFTKEILVPVLNRAKI